MVYFDWTEAYKQQKYFQGDWPRGDQTAKGHGSGMRARNCQSRAGGQDQKMLRHVHE